MNLFASSPTWLLGVLAVLLAAAAIQDAISLRISNLITALVLALALVAMAMAGFRIGLWENLAVFLIVLVIGTALFSSNILGGGDVKLIAAVGLWADLETALRLMIAISIAGGLLAILVITLRSIVPSGAKTRVRTLQPGSGIPYGIAIGLGALVVIGMAQLGGRAGTYNPDLPTLQT